MNILEILLSNKYLKAADEKRLAEKINPLKQKIADLEQKQIEDKINTAKAIAEVFEK